MLVGTNGKWRVSALKVFLAVVSLLVASLVGVVVVASPAVADVSAPSWWNGKVCDTDNYPGSYALGASFNGVKACGPGPYNQGGSDHSVNFYAGAWGEYEWECVELVMRYMYLVYGVAPYNSPGGKDVVDNYSGSALTKVTNDGTSSSPKVPSPGDVISLGGTSGNPYGHTAVVTGVSVANGSGSITIMQQNATADGWGTLTVSGGKITGTILGVTVSKWLHNPSSGSGNSLAEGTFFQNQGSTTVYEMVGGAALPVPSWASVGGVHSVTVISPTPYPSTPADGTFIQVYGSTTVYVMAGGAAVYVPSWASVGGYHAPVVIPAGYSYPSTPADGTFIQDFGYTSVYEMVGGAALFVPSWASVGGQQSVAVIPATVFPSTPADGTLIEDFGYSNIYEIAGGAAFSVPYWGAIGGARPFVVIPATVFPQYPSDGTYIKEYGGSTVNTVAGGAALAVSAWSNVGGPYPVAEVPTGAISSQMRPYPADGAYVKGYQSGEEFVSNGSAVTRVTSTPLPAATTVDDWAIINQLGGTL